MWLPLKSRCGYSIHPPVQVDEDSEAFVSYLQGLDSAVISRL